MKNPTETFPLDKIREGRRVTVAFMQSGAPVCELRGRFEPPPKDRTDLLPIYAVVIGGNGSTFAFILSTDHVTWVADTSTIRVDLRGRRFPLSIKPRRQS